MRVNAEATAHLATAAAAAAAAAGSRMEVVILRLPLVFGSGVRANFYRLLESVDRGLPLPLGAIHNRRSLLNVWNLCDLLLKTLQHPAAAGRIWLVSDGEDLSTPELIRRIARDMHRKARLLPVPRSVLYALGRLTGRQAQITQLCGSLAVDVSDTRDALNWQPPVPVDEGLDRTVSWYLSEGRRRS
jgi:UDP-glucose 4-epimerase